MGAAWARHAMCESAFTLFKIQTVDRVRNENIVSHVARILGSILTDRRTGNSMNTSKAEILTSIL